MDGPRDYHIKLDRGFPGGAAIKILPANAKDTIDTASIPGFGRFPGLGNGSLLQYSCLKSSMNTGTGQAIVHAVTKGQTRLSS